MQTKTIDTSQRIFLGYEVGTGEEVSIPLHHQVVTGVTRLSGKTTTAEAIMARLPEGFTSLAFRTKRGEIAFPKAQQAQPYLATRTDWEYVQSLLEAAMRERLKFERSWIINATRGASSLRQVYDNIVRARDSGKARALDQSVFTNLAAYFEKVLPQIEAHPFTSTLEISPGPNVMDLGHLSEEVQALVIASCLEEIWQHGCNCLVVIPEAWAFIPQSRGNPVKWAAQHVIRQGGAVGVYLLIDSQDIASVDKAVLKSCGVWLLGRQQERNEVERVLDQLPVPRSGRPKPEDVMTLPPGVFFVAAEDWCRKVYVQPGWLDAEQAREVARGTLSLPQRPQPEQEEDAMLQQENTRMARELALTKEVLDTSQNNLREKEEQLRQLGERLKQQEKENLKDVRLWRALQDFRTSMRVLLALEQDLGNGVSEAFPDHAALVEDVARRVLRELPERDGSGGRPILQLAPAPAIQESLRVQLEERLFKGLGALPERQKHILAVLVGADAPLTIQEIARRLGVDVSTSGGAQSTWSTDVNTLVKEGWVYRDAGKRGFKHKVQKKAVETLQGVTSKEEDLEVAVATVLTMLATPIVNGER